MLSRKIQNICLNEESTVRQCIELIDKNKQGIALIVDSEGRLTGTVTDGDIRRFILCGQSLDAPAENVMWRNPLTAPIGTAESEIKKLMNRNLVRNIPIIDAIGRPRSLVTINDLMTGQEDERIALIMAGGEGKRLWPLTQDIPKPLIKVGDKPIIENIINSFAEAGIMNIYISVNYKSKVIEDYLKKRFNHGLKITCLKEHKKLGTAGALTLLPEIPSKPFIVINGDIITKTNFDRLIEFHTQHRCVMTVAASQYMLQIPYGVLNLSSHYLLSVDEKPRQTFLCNAGIYVINPDVMSFIPRDTEYDMTHLIRELVRRGLPVTTFPIHEYWIDIGQLAELKKAESDMKELNGAILAE